MVRWLATPCAVRPDGKDLSLDHDGIFAGDIRLHVNISLCLYITTHGFSNDGTGAKQHHNT